MNAGAIPSLSTEAQQELSRWVAEHGISLPEPVRIALAHHALLVKTLGRTERAQRELLVQFRRALGVTPSSERRTSTDPLGPISGGDGKKPRSARERLLVGQRRLERLSSWHLDIAIRQDQRCMRINERLENMPPEDAYDVADDDFEPTAEHRARVEEQTRAFQSRLSLGGVTEPALQSVTETLMSGAQVTTCEDSVDLPAPTPQGEGIEVIDTRTEERVRYDFTLVVGRVVANVEKKVIVDENGRRRMVSASTAALGPPRFGVTWRFLVNAVVLIVQYAMPMNRLANLLSTDEKRFTAAAMSRMLRYVAERFLPIYLYLFDELADAEVLRGDDTQPRVLEVNRYFRRRDKGATEPSPWTSYRSRETAAETIAATAEGERGLLGARLARELGFEFERRSGEGAKTSLNTTVVSGRADETDPRSLIVFYRSHFGGFGNLLEVLLERRAPHLRDVLVQSDLATVNLVHDPELRRRFTVKQFGCASHARRPFVLHEHEDPELCPIMQHLFKGLAIHEHGLDLYGRNEENVRAVRGVDSRQMWEKIKNTAKTVTKRWSPESKLGRAARYIIRHYDALTAYLDDPRLEPSNNLSERLLRLEKLIESGSMFRSTLDGRFALDILRTVLQTAIAARAPLQEYVLGVLMASAEEIESHPERYTPREWARRHIDLDGEGFVPEDVLAVLADPSAE